MTDFLVNTHKHCWRRFTLWTFDVFYQTGPIVCTCNAITPIMSAHSPVAHYLKWFMGFIQANLAQCLVLLLVCECDACLSLTELMLLLLRVRVRSSFPSPPSRWLNLWDVCIHTGTLLLSLTHSRSSAPCCMLIVSGLNLACDEKILMQKPEK